MQVPTPVALPGAAALSAHLDHLGRGLLERGTAVRLLLAALAQEHVLLIGPPGTAKSELARRLHDAFAGTRYFERLLTRFSTPEELFGPLSLKALEADRYERLIDGYLPTAGIAFLDEVFKANSAILNALLTLLNEREFDNGAGRLRTPLISLVGASNEAPGDESLVAFHDRFLLRVPVGPVGDESFAALLCLREAAPAAPPPLDVAVLPAIARAADAVALPQEAVEALTGLRGFVQQAGLPVSDRRWRQLVRLMRVAAATEGRTRLDAVDLWLAPYVVCDSAEAVPRVAEWVAHTLMGAAPQPLPGLGAAVAAFEKQLDLERSLPPEDGDDSAGKLALARSIGGGEARGGEGEGGLLRIATAALEAHLQRRFSSVHVAARTAQVDELLSQVHEAAARVQAQLDDLQRQLAGPLWLPADVADAWCAPQRRTLALLATHAARLAQLRAGFAALPVDDTRRSAPAPVAW